MNLKKSRVAGASVLLKALADLLWPPVCAACSRLLPLMDEDSGSNRHFCHQCFDSIEFIPAAVCDFCGRPFYSSPGHICGGCLASTPFYRQARSAIIYQGAAARSIALLKYYGDLTQVKVLSDLARPLAESLMAENGFDAIIPMPISGGRYRQRGFNQALELSLDLYAPWRKILEVGALSRSGDENVHQAALSAKSRAKVIKGCFAVKEPGKVQGARLLLFDDVFTTGATAAEATITLLRAGAAAVDIFTIACAVLRSWR